MTQPTVLRGASVFDGETFLEGPHDLVLEDASISKICKTGKTWEGSTVVDVEGKTVCPGFIDIHCHLRDPGQEWREDILTGSMAGAAGGFSTIVAMPNTDPPVDSPSLVRYVIDRSQRAGGARVLPAGCITNGRRGETLCEMRKMADEGAVLFTDDGSPVSNANIFRLALRYSGMCGVRLMEHPEEKTLTAGAQVNEGACSAVTGLKGWPASAESSHVARCIALAAETSVPVHLTHVSTAGSMRMIENALKEGVKVSCDVTPHHLVMEEGLITSEGFDAIYKVNPPLRSRADRDALWNGISSGAVTAIATDHAPYHFDEKDLPFQEASFGIASLEAAVAGVLNEWNKRGKPCDLERMLQLFTSGPAGVLGKVENGMGGIREGGPADITVLDLSLKRVVDSATWLSKCRFSPWNGRELTGWPVMTFVSGEMVFNRD